MALRETLEGRVEIDLDDVFSGLLSAFRTADFGDVRFDASGVLGIASGMAHPDLAGVDTALGGVQERLRARVEAGVPGATLPTLVADVQGRLASVGPLPDIPTPGELGIDGLAARLDAVTEAVHGGPLEALLGLLPGIDAADAIGRVTGGAGGVLALLRVLAGLLGTATASAGLEQRAARVAAMLDADRARGEAARLQALTADAALVAALRAADPSDLALAERLGREVTSFCTAVLGVADTWSAGMGFGEAALVGLDLPAGAASLEVARLTLANADLAHVAALAADLRAAAEPVLALPLPDPGGAAGAAVDQALALVDALTAAVDAWSPATLTEPVVRVTSRVTEPVAQVRQALEAIGTGAVAAIHAVRDLVDEVDLAPVAEAVRRMLQPVVDLLDAVEDAIGAATATLEDVAEGLTAGLRAVAQAVEDARAEVVRVVAAVTGPLDDRNLDELAATLQSALGGVSSALAAARLTPYFDGALDVIDTSAGVLDAVPFSLLPTDVQQEVVDAGRPIRELELEPLQRELSEELAGIRAALGEDALADVAEAYADVLEFLATLDPGPHLVRLEAEAIPALRQQLAAVDPRALLAPLDEQLRQVRGLLDGLDLETTVLAPLDSLFQPVLDALDALDPSALLRDAREEVDAARGRLQELVPVDRVLEALTTLRDDVAARLGRIDPAPLATVLDEGATAALRALSSGPPGGAFGSALVAVAQAGGLQASEPAVADMLAWVGGRAQGSAVVRGRLANAESALAGVHETVAALDPEPLAAAAQAQHRALRAAVSGHPDGSPLRAGIEARLDAVEPATALGALVENRRRYLLELDAALAVARTLAASQRGEVDEAARGLREALVPLDAIPARVRALLGAFGVEGAGAPLGDLLGHLLAQAGPERLIPALGGLVTVARDRVLAALDAVLAPVRATVEDLAAILAALDFRPIVTELETLHEQVAGEVAALSPRALLGPAVTAADDIVARLRAFDPLAPVRTLLNEVARTADELVEGARPTIVFAPVIEAYAALLELARGLDVTRLLGPVLEALDGLVVQLDDGFARTREGLERLQQALPSEVSDSPVGVDVGISASVGF